jgi:hypothetical protein
MPNSSGSVLRVQEHKPPEQTTEHEERMAEALRRIQGWCDAYPVEVFPEPDLDAIRSQIGDGPMSSLHAAWARHLLKGIATYARQGLCSDE